MTESIQLFSPEPAADNKSATTIEQVRDLLFGEARRQHDTRFAELDHAIKSMDSRIAEQLRAMEVKMEAMSQALSTRHEESLRQIGEALVSIGRHIAALGSSNEHDRDRKA